MPKPIAGPDTEFISAWLHQLGLGAYLRTFLDNDIDAAVLSRLTSADLEELGVSSVGHRRRLLDAIGRLAAAENLSAEPGHRPVSTLPLPVGARPVVVAE